MWWATPTALKIFGKQITPRLTALWKFRSRFLKGDCAMKITAAVTREAKAPFILEEVELQAPRTDELLVRIKAVGICHTDAAAQMQDLPVPLPAVLGHEGAGVVARVGPNVTEFREGDHVCLTFASCGHCVSCMAGKPYGCENMFAINFGGVMTDGTRRLSRDGRELSCFFAQSSFATYAVVHKNNAVLINEDIDLAVAAPFGCGIQTGAGIVLNRLRPEFGSALAVFGCGTVGMSAVMAAKIAGCAEIIAVSGNQKSLRLAAELGANHTINRNDTDNIPEVIRDISDGGLDYAIDTSGVESIIKTALASLCYMGSLVVAGAGLITIHTGLELGAKTLIGVTEGDSIPKLFIPKLIKYYQKGLFPVDRLLSCFKFAEINRAFAVSRSGEVIKAVLRIDA
jgi:aryl-alcohol dehydrogenase